MTEANPNSVFRSTFVQAKLKSHPPIRVIRATRGEVISAFPLREVSDARHSRCDKGGSFMPKAFPSMPEAGDASEAFLRIAAPTRLL